MQALSVTAIVSFLREVLESNEIFSDLWVAGEVSNYSRSAAGHRYYSLKDPGAVLRSVMFNSAMPGMQLKDGDRVLAHGKITIYPQRGDLQFVVDFVRPEGVGILAARYEELKQRLGEEGL
ncbi:MAG: exodeoxyribonuclease VII large subunit, partial [Dehalococcoidia bacterium]